MITYNSTAAFGGSLNRSNTFSGPMPIRRRQFMLQSTPIPEGDLRLREYRSQGVYQSSFGMNGSWASTLGANSSARLNESREGGSNERFIKPHLFGDTNQRREERLKNQAAANTSGRHVSFSPNLPTRREMFPDFHTEPIQRPIPKPQKKGYILFEKHNKDSSIKEQVEEPLPKPVHRLNGPPLRFLKDTMPTIKRPRVDVKSPIPIEDPDEEDYWVTVFGFPLSKKSVVLELFGRHGAIVKHTVPERGNYLQIRYCSPIHANQAVDRNGQMLNPAIFLGVLPTRCLERINGEKFIEDEAEDMPEIEEPPKKSNKELGIRPSVSNGVDTLPVGIRNIGYSFEALPNDNSSTGIMDRILSAFA